MNGDRLDQAGLAALLAAQRDAFDQSFALPPPAPPGASRAVLAIRVGDERFALPLEQVSALQRRERIVPLPGCAPWVLGIIGVRGQAAPAYSLAQLLGCGEPGGEGWLALHGRDQPLAFAFAGFEGMHTVPGQEPGQEQQPVVALAGHNYTVLDLSALAAVAARLDAPAPSDSASGAKS